MEKQNNIVHCTVCNLKVYTFHANSITFGDIPGIKIPLCARCTQDLRNHLINERKKQFKE